MSKAALVQEAKDLGIKAKGLARMKNANLELLIKEAQNTKIGVGGTLKHRILELHGEGLEKKEIFTKLESEDWAKGLKCGKIRMGYIYTVIRNAK